MILIPKRYDNARITDFGKDTPGRVVASRYIENLSSNFENGMAPCFFGVSGSGKTHLSAAILNFINEYTTPKLSTAWFPASETLNRMLDYRDMHLRDSYMAIWSALRETDVIVLDDISTIRNSPRVMEYFWMIVEARYAEKLSTIYTANFLPEPEKDIWESVAEHFTAPLARRIAETAHGLTVVI